jgi:phage tail-like protein
MTTIGFNAAFAAATSALGVRLDPYMSFNFLVEIEGLLVGGFSEVRGLEVQTEVKEYQEGGRNEYMHKLPGPTRYPNNLSLKHGLIDLETLWSWHQDVVQGTVERKNGSIYLLDAKRLPAMWWDFKEAYPVKWTGPDFNAGSGNVATETIELAHRGISKPAASSLLSAARGAMSLTFG